MTERETWSAAALTSRRCAQRLETSFSSDSKLHRLSRAVAFVSGSWHNARHFIAAELGRDVDPFLLHLYAALAEKERSLISDWTEAALRARKAGGAKLGNPRNIQLAGAIGRKIQTASADEFAASMLAVLTTIRSAGAETLEAMTCALNQRGIRSARGGRWYASCCKANGSRDSYADCPSQRFIDGIQIWKRHSARAETRPLQRAAAARAVMLPR